MILVLDNYDSFTYNIVEYLKQLGRETLVKKNDACSLAEIEEINPSKIIISPGPSHPKNSGNCLAIIKSFHQKIPFLGICLGLQCLAYGFGAKIEVAAKIYHGKPSTITHHEKSLFKGISNPFKAIRYHSLVVNENSLTSDFLITAKSEDDEIMALEHKQFPLYGVQFHPESIGSEHGHELLRNFLTLENKKVVA